MNTHPDPAPIAREEEHERLLAIMRATLEATADGILVVGPDGKILLHNRQFTTMWQLPPGLAGTDSARLFDMVRGQLKDGEQEQRAPEALFRPLAAEGSGRIEFADGRVFEHYTTQLSGGVGGIGRVLCCRDITARVASEEEVLRAKEAAEAGNRAKSEFLDNVSHEIRTPLNGVLGLARLLLAEDLTPRQRNFAQLAEASAASLLDLVEDLLDLGKIESGRMDLEQAPFRLDELVQQLAGVYELRAKEKGLAFSLDIDQRVPLTVQGDAGRLRQVLNNLLSNALKFTEQGEFGLVVGAGTAGRGSDMLLFTVYDTGIGIPYEAQQRLFTRFTQADRATSRRYGGTGLGLAIVKQLCDMMGGAILLQSEPRRGSSFRCELPLPAVPLAQVPVAAPPPAETSSPRLATRVLVAEDNETNQVVVRGLLAQAGYHDVTVVADGQQVLDAMAAHEFDLVLMDCRMPVVDGYHAASRLRADGFTQPIIALTANAAAGERERCLAWGMNDYLSKPVDPARLRGVLAEWTGGPAAATAAVDGVTPSGPVGAESLFRRGAALDRLGGDLELLAVALQSFRDHAPRVLRAAEEALAAGERDDLRRHLHSLAGSAAMVGAAPLHGAAKELETHAASGALSAVQAALPALKELMGRFIAESMDW